MTLGSHFSTRSLPYRMLDTRLPHDDTDARGPGAELVTADGRALPLRSATLVAHAAGGIARVVLEQTFENVHAETLNVTYRMPLPADGAVSGYRFAIDGRLVEGRVERKEEARATFEAAIAAGKTAALVEQEKADIFTQEIGNIPPHTTIVARITVDQRLAWLPEGEWELRFPTVIGPRYVGTTESREDARAVGILTSEGPLSVRLALDIRVGDMLAPGRRIESPSHAIDAGEDGSVSLRAKEGARLDRDVVVRWGVAKPSVGATLRAGKLSDGSGAYGLLTVVPPSAEARIAPVARDLVVLLDTSGSMSGAPLDLAKRVVSQILDSLTEADQFEVIEFGDRPNRYHAEALTGTTARKRDAVRWVMARKASGGTEMYSAVLEALRPLRVGAQRQVVLVTDGYIGGEQQIVRLCKKSLPVSCRLHVVGVGSATNRALSTALARAGRGAEILVGIGEDPERAGKRLLDRTAAPMLTDVVIEGTGIAEHVPAQLPDVFAGAPLVCALRLAPGGGDIRIRGRLAHDEWSQRLRVPATDHVEVDAAIGALFGRERVADLETDWSIGENAGLVDTLIEETGVAFQIATRLTSWVAVDTVVSIDPYASSRTESVPQELPYGTSMQGFGGGGGATSTRAGTLKGGSMQLLQALASLPSSMSARFVEPQAISGPAPAPPPMMARPQPGTGVPPAFGVMQEPPAMVSGRKAAGRPRLLVLLTILIGIVIALAVAAWILFR